MCEFLGQANWQLIFCVQLLTSQACSALPKNVEMIVKYFFSQQGETSFF